MNGPEAGLNLDALLANAREQTKDVEMPKTTPEEPAPVANLEDLLAQKSESIQNVTIEDATTKAEQERIKEEKRIEAYTALKPKIDELAEMLSHQKLFEGKKNYFALKDNLEGYKNTALESRVQRYDTSVLFEEIAKEYKDATGEEFYFSSVPMQFRDEKYVYVDGSYDRLNGISKDEYVSNGKVNEANMTDYMRGTKMTLQGNGLGLPEISTRHDRAISNSPEDYVSNLQKIRAYHHSREYNLQPGILDSDKEKGTLTEVPESTKQIDDKVSEYDRDAQGFALGAFEAGDMRTAAQALAFAESVQKMNPNILKMVGEKINSLTPTQTKEFLTMFDREKSKYQTQ